MKKDYIKVYRINTRKLVELLVSSNIQPNVALHAIGIHPSAIKEMLNSMVFDVQSDIMEELIRATGVDLTPSIVNEGLLFDAPEIDVDTEISESDEDSFLDKDGDCEFMSLCDVECIADVLRGLVFENPREQKFNHNTINIEKAFPSSAEARRVTNSIIQSDEYKPNSLAEALKDRIRILKKENDELEKDLTIARNNCEKLERENRELKILLKRMKSSIDNLYSSVDDFI